MGKCLRCKKSVCSNHGRVFDSSYVAARYGYPIVVECRSTKCNDNAALELRRRILQRTMAWRETLDKAKRPGYHLLKQIDKKLPHKKTGGKKV